MKPNTSTKVNKLMLLYNVIQIPWFFAYSYLADPGLDPSFDFDSRYDLILTFFIYLVHPRNKHKKLAFG